jgi:HEAT repeat protein
LKEQAVPALQQALHGEHEHLRAAAANALGTLGFEAQGAVPALLQALEDKEAEIRAVVAEALGKIAVAETQVSKRGLRTKAAYAALLFYSKVDHSDRVQRAAAEAAKAASRLGRVVADREQGDARILGAYALAEIGPDARGEVGSLLSALREGSTALQVAAAYALGEVGVGRATAPGLLEGLRDAAASTEENVAAAARAALRKIQPK